jgi:hypothetical protein
MKLITDRRSLLKLVDVDTHEGGEDLISVDNDERGYISDYESDFALILTGDREKMPLEYLDYLDSIGMFPTDLGIGMISDEDREMLGLSSDNDGAMVNIRIVTDASIRHIHDPGDYYTPPYSESEIDDINTATVEEDAFMIDGDSINITDEMQLEIDIYNRIIESMEPTEVLESISKLADSGKKTNTFTRNSDLSTKLGELFYNYTKDLVNLDKNGLSNEDKMKWSKIDKLDINRIKERVEEIIKRQKELEEIDLDNELELTNDQIDESNALFDELYKLVPEDRTKFKYNKGINGTLKLDKIYDNRVRGSLISLTRNLQRPDEFKKELEKELLYVNYHINKGRILNNPPISTVPNKQKKIDFYLNQSK